MILKKSSIKHKKMNSDGIEYQKILLKLIDLKQSALNTSNYDEFNRNINLVDGLNKLKLLHEKKLSLFRNRILLFESFFEKNMSKLKMAEQTLRTCQEDIANLEMAKVGLKIELEKIKAQRDNKHFKLERYQKHIKFLEDSFILMTKTHELNIVEQLISRYEGLEMILRENKRVMEVNQNEFAQMRNLKAKASQKASDKLLVAYQKMRDTKAKQEAQNRKVFEAQELFELSLKRYGDKEVEKGLILGSVNNFYDLVANYRKMPKEDEEKKLDNIGDIDYLFDKLDFVAESINKLRDSIENFN